MAKTAVPTTPSQNGLSTAPDTVSRDEAIRLLGVKKETLYTYVSRGWIRSYPLNEGRDHIFSRSDVERMRARSLARAGIGPLAESAMRFGEPIISTCITEITSLGPRYRGYLATDLATQGASFECVAQLLWLGVWNPKIHWEDVSPFAPTRQGSDEMGSRTDDFVKLMAGIVLELGSGKLISEQGSFSETLAASRNIIKVLTATLGYIGPEQRYLPMRQGDSIAAAVLRNLGVDGSPEMHQTVDALMVLCADYELTPASFSARVAASAGADLYACVAAGLCAHSGLFTGQVCDKLAQLMANPRKVPDLSELLFRTGAKEYGFNHSLAKGIEPRAKWMIGRAELLAKKYSSKSASQMMEFLTRVEADFDLHPGLPAGLVVLTTALGLPNGSAAAIWGIARTAGQIANVIEQREAGFLLRPRANFVSSKGIS